MTNKEKIIRAAKVDDLEEIYELIDQGIDPFAMDINGKTAISYVFNTLYSAQMKKLSKKIARYLYTRHK